MVVIFPTEVKIITVMVIMVIIINEVVIVKDIWISTQNYNGKTIGLAWSRLSSTANLFVKRIISLLNKFDANLFVLCYIYPYHLNYVEMIKNDKP